MNYFTVYVTRKMEENKLKSHTFTADFVTCRISLLCPSGNSC